MCCGYTYCPYCGYTYCDYTYYGKVGELERVLTNTLTYPTYQLTDRLTYYT